MSDPIQPLHRRSDLWQSFVKWKVPDAKTVHSAVYSAALSLTDEEIERVVKDALIRARRDLSS